MFGYPDETLSLVFDILLQLYQQKITKQPLDNTAQVSNYVDQVSRSRALPSFTCCHLLILSCKTRPFTFSSILGIYREVYTSINGDTIEELYRHPKFPESPDFVEVLTTFDATLDDNNGYGERLSTFYEVRNCAVRNRGSIEFELKGCSVCRVRGLVAS